MLIPWRDLSEPQYQTGKAVGDLIRSAGSFYCWAARNYPKWALGDPLGIGALTRGINDQLCPGEAPLPPPDQPALPNGRCFCSRYRITYTVDPDNAPPFTASFELNGPVSVLGWVPGFLPGTYDYRVVAQNDSCNGVRTENLVANISQAAINNEYKVTVNSLVLLSGSDNCGGQLPRYTPITPPASDLRRNVTINLAPNIPVTIPVILVRPNVDLTLSPNVNINLQPRFDFPDIGVNIGFDIGGVNIGVNIDSSTNPSFYFPPDPRPNPPQLPPTQGRDPDLSILYERLRQLKQQLDKIEGCACETEPVLTPVNLGSGNSGTFTLPAKTRFVVLTLTTVPGNAKSQAGLNAPNVLYAGWAWYRNVLNSLSERESVDANVKYYIATPQATQFCFTLYGGFVGNAVAYRES